MIFLPSGSPVPTPWMVTEITPPVPTSTAETYLLATLEQPASASVAGRVLLAAAYSATEVLHAPAAATASVTFERFIKS